MQRRETLGQSVAPLISDCCGQLACCIFFVTLMPAASVSTFTAAENPRHKPCYISCFSEDRSGRNVEDSLVLILHQRINQFKYKSIDK